MTTAIPEDFFTLAIPLRKGVPNNYMVIPEDQRRGDAYNVSLPAGMHTIQLLWRGDATPIHVRLWDGAEHGRNIAVLPGGSDAKAVTVSVVVAPGGAELSFIQQYAVTVEQAATPPNALGVNVILNPARTQEA